MPLPPLAASRITEFTRAELFTDLGYDSSIGGALETFVGWSIKTTVGSAVGPIGAVVFLGLELGSLIEFRGLLVPGARVRIRNSVDGRPG